MSIKRSTFLAITISFLFGVSMVVFHLHRYSYQNLNAFSKEVPLYQLINQAGRQRMISQRILVLTQLSSGEERIDNSNENNPDSLQYRLAETHQWILDQSALFDQQYSGFDSLTLLQEKAGDLLTEFTTILNDSSSTEDGTIKLFNTNTQFLLAMDRWVDHLEKYAQWKQKDSLSIYNRNQTKIIWSVIINALIVYLLSIYFINQYAKKTRKLQLALENANVLRKKKLNRLELLISSIQVGIWERDVFENTQYWSPQFYQILGFEEKEIPGTAESFQSRVHPQDLPLLLEASETAIRHNIPKTVEIRVKKKSGEYIWIEATGNAKRNEAGKTELLIAGILDINNKKVLENQLISFVNKAPAAIAMLDENLTYIAYSDQWLLLCELSDQSLINKHHYEVLTNLDDQQKKIYERCLHGESFSVDSAPFVRKDGSLRFLKWEINPWYADQNKIGGIILFAEDVTDILQQKEYLISQKEAAERLTEIKTEFLSTMSHEIRTPLNGIIGIAEILKAESHLPSQENYLDILTTSCQNLHSLVNNVLDINKLELDKFELHPLFIDFQDFIKSILHTHRHLAQQKGISLHLFLDDTIPSIIKTDKIRLAQVLNNLLSNAIKFTHQGSVSLSIRKTKQTTQSISLQFEIIDSGIGISKKDLAKLFDPYQQAVDHPSKQSVGTGLGLYLSKKIIEKMNGKVSIQSEKGKGTTLAFELLTEFGERNNLDAEVSMNQVHTVRFSSHILIVEDNKVNQLIFERFLDPTGITIDFADSGSQAIKKIESNRYDLVLMDIQLPDMTGIECVQWIRNKLKISTKKLPILAVTADITTERKEEILATGLQQILYKPINKSELITALSNVLLLSNVTQHDREEVFITNAKEAIRYYSGDNPELQLEMVDLLHLSFDELKTELLHAYDQKKPEILRNIRHKLISAIKIMNTKKIDKYLKDIQTKFDLNVYEYEAVQTILNEITYIKEVLNKIKTENQSSAENTN